MRQSPLCTWSEYVHSNVTWGTFSKLWGVFIGQHSHFKIGNNEGLLGHISVWNNLFYIYMCSPLCVYASTQWCPEVCHHLPDVPFILVGLKRDLRNDPRTLKELKKNKEEPVRQSDAMAMAEEMGAESYFECSAKLNEGLKELFEHVTIITTSKSKRSKAVMKIPFLKWFKGNISVHSVIKTCC